MFAETIQTFFLRLKDVFLNFHFIPDILDILLVTLLVYAVIVQLRKTQSIQVIKGIVFVAIVYGLVSILNMSASTYIFNRLLSDIILIVVILFSGEIRQGLEHMGARSFGKKLPFLNRKNEEDELDAINAVCRACGAMSRNKVGSLILFQRQTLLGDLTKQAVMIDSETSYEMICSIFYPKAPLHDGAVIIRNERIYAARCRLPSSKRLDLPTRYGMRHRAALGISEHSDAAVVIVSEQTGEISFALNGEIYPDITLSELEERLDQCLMRSQDTESGEEGLRAMLKNRVAALRKKLAPVKEDENEDHQEDRQ